MNATQAGNGRIARRCNTLLGLLAIVLLLAPNAAVGAIFAWPSKEGSELGKVRFLNGYVATVAKNEVHDARRVSVHDAAGQEAYFFDITEHHVEIVAAYPGAQAASVALVRTACGRNRCRPDVHLMYVSGQALHSAKIGPLGNDLSVTIDLADPGAPRVTAAGVTGSEENAYGDLVRSTRMLISGKGLVDPRAKSEYVALIGKHPEGFLGDSALRAPLAARLGPTRIRELRQMIRIGTIEIVEGRYLKISGCCSFEHEGQVRIVVDAIGGGMWAAWIAAADRSANVGSTLPWSEHIVQLMRETGMPLLLKAGQLLYETPKAVAAELSRPAPAAAQPTAPPSAPSQGTRSAAPASPLEQFVPGSIWESPLLASALDKYPAVKYYPDQSVRIPTKGGAYKIQTRKLNDTDIPARYVIVSVEFLKNSTAPPPASTPGTSGSSDSRSVVDCYALSKYAEARGHGFIEGGAIVKEAERRGACRW